MNNIFKIFVCFIIIFISFIFTVNVQAIVPDRSKYDNTNISVADQLSNKKCENENICPGLCHCEFAYIDGYNNKFKRTWNFFNAMPGFAIVNYIDDKVDEYGKPSPDYSWKIWLQFSKDNPDTAAIDGECSIKTIYTDENAQPRQNYQPIIDKNSCQYYKPFCCCTVTDGKKSNCARSVNYDTNTFQPVCLDGKTKFNEVPSGCTSLNTTITAPTNRNEASNQALGEALHDLQREAKDLNRLPYSGMAALIGQVMRFFLWSIGAFAFVLYIYAGVLWMTSAGNAEQVTQAKNIFIWVTLGLLAIFGSSIVVNQVFKFISAGGTI